MGRPSTQLWVAREGKTSCVNLGWQSNGDTHIIGLHGAGNSACERRPRKQPCLFRRTTSGTLSLAYRESSDLSALHPAPPGGLTRARLEPRAASGPTPLALARARRVGPVPGSPRNCGCGQGGPVRRRAAVGRLLGAEAESGRLSLVQRAVYDLDRQPTGLSVRSGKARAAAVPAVRAAWFSLLRPVIRGPQTPSSLTGDPRSRAYPSLPHPADSRLGRLWVQTLAIHGSDDISNFFWRSNSFQLFILAGEKKTLYELLAFFKTKDF